jgi:putative acetyltransferase
LSLLAISDDKAIGHILFTKARITNSNNSISAVILAPLAVIPDAQSRGVGGQLINKGLKLLSKLGVELVFVLGHPEYYPRHGFKTAGVLGFEAPYPIPEKHANAWMGEWGSSLWLKPFPQVEYRRSLARLPDAM